jgi:hypothetical protein
MTQVYSITIEPRNTEYRQLIDVACLLGRQGLFVVQKSSEATQKFIDAFSIYVNSIQERDEWPGTKLGERIGFASGRGSGAKIYEFVLVNGSLELLKGTAEGLFEWLHPQLPEDLCFLDFEGRPWLTTISHERDAYLCVTQDQLSVIVAAVPNLKICLDEEIEDKG